MLRKRSMKRILLILILFSLIMGTGCWDRVDIERNAFILGIGIDQGENSELLVTFQIAILEAFKGEDGGDGEATQQISISANTVIDATRDLLKKINTIPTFAHCKLIIFGEEYAKNGIHDTLDFFFRDPDIRRRTSVCVSKGQAQKILEQKSKLSKSSALEINQIITENSMDDFQIYSFQDVGKLHEDFIRDSPFLMTKVSIDKGTPYVSGVGVFKDNKLIGWFEGGELMGLRWFLGDIKRGLIQAKLPWEQGGRIAFNAYGTKTSTVTKIKENQILVKTMIYVEGDIKDIENPAPMEDPQKANKIWAEAMEEEIRAITYSVFKKGQDVYGVDTFEIDEKVESYYPEFWQEHEKEWEELFKKAELELDVDVRIRRIGSIEP